MRLFGLRQAVALPLWLERFGPLKCLFPLILPLFFRVLQVKAFLADPSAFVVAAPVAAEAAAPAAAAAAPAKEAPKEESEESDEDMGFGLFD